MILGNGSIVDSGFDLGRVFAIVSGFLIIENHLSSENFRESM